MLVAYSRLRLDEESEGRLPCEEISTLSNSSRPEGGTPLKIPTVKERVLLHLFDYHRFLDDFEAPIEVTQEGIAQAVGIRVHHVTQNVRPLLSEEALQEKTSHIRHGKRRRKVYFLTPLGRNQAASLRSALLKAEVPFRARNGEIHEAALTEIYQERRRGTPLCHLLLELKTLRYIPEEGAEEEAGIVDFAKEAPAVENFFGREEELTQAVNAVNQVPLVVVAGMAGIGKSALGSKVCEALRGQQSLFWRKIRDFDGAVDLALRLGRFLKSMGRDAVHSELQVSGPKALSRIEDLLLEDLAGVESVLIFDDVHEASEEALSFLGLLFRVLRKRPGSSALFLSRSVPALYSRREVVEGAVVELSLGRLDPDSCQAILTEAEIPKPLIGPMIKAAGGNPLFLRLLAKLGARGVPEVQTLEVYISEEIEPRLSSPERRCLEVASLYQVPVPPSGLLLEKGVRTRVLVSLRKKGLMEHIEPDHLFLHDTLRSYFGRGVSAERREEIAGKVVPWLRNAAQDLAEGGSPEQGIVFVQNAVAVDTNPSRLVSSLEVLGRLRKFVGDLPGAIEAYRTALRHAREPDDQARLHRKIAIAHILQGNFDEAEGEIDAGLALLPPEPTLEAAWLNLQKGSIAYRRMDYARCLRIAERLLGWWPHLPEDPDLYGALVNLRALVYIEDARRFDPVLAQADLEEAEKAFKKSGNRRYLALVYNNMGLNAVERHDGEAALKYLDRALEVAKAAGDLQVQASALFTKGGALMLELEDYAAAEATYQESYRRNKETHQHQRVMFHYWHFAQLHRRQGRFEEAREDLEYFLQSSGELEDRAFLAQNLGLMVRLCVLCGDGEAAERYFDEAWKLVEEVHSESAEKATAWAKGVLLAYQGDTEGAQESFGEALEQPMPYDRAEVLLEYGRFLAESGKVAEARTVLLQASEESKMSPTLEATAQEELRALDATHG